MNSEEIKQKHQETIENKKNFYLDKDTGFVVWTEEFLLNRGFCCENGCRHCPYKENKK